MDDVANDDVGQGKVDTDTDCVCGFVYAWVHMHVRVLNCSHRTCSGDDQRRPGHCNP